jgi:DNA-binding IclR family transcriptional regulator
LLEDGSNHTLEELKRKTDLNQNQISRVVEFLEEYNFVVFDEEKQEVRLDKAAQKFLA